MSPPVQSLLKIQITTGGLRERRHTHSHTHTYTDTENIQYAISHTLAHTDIHVLVWILSYHFNPLALPSEDSVRYRGAQAKDTHPWGKLGTCKHKHTHWHTWGSEIRQMTALLLTTRDTDTLIIEQQMAEWGVGSHCVCLCVGTCWCACLHMCMAFELWTTQLWLLLV